MVFRILFLILIFFFSTPLFSSSLLVEDSKTPFFSFPLTVEEKKSSQVKEQLMPLKSSLKVIKPHKEVDIKVAQSSPSLSKEFQDLLSLPKSKLVKEVSHLIKNYSTQNPKDQLSLIHQLSHPQFLQALLNALTANSELLSQIVQKSYYHHNGFDKLVLLEEEDYNLRLHIWWKGNTEINQENIHNHRWDFVSSILLGSMTQDFFQIINTSALEQNVTQIDEEVLSHYLYHPYKRNPKKLLSFFCRKKDRYQMKHLGYAVLKPLMKINIPQGHSYCLDRKELHRVSVENQETVATLMMYTKPYGESSEVFSDTPKDFFIRPDSQAVKVKAFTEEEVCNKLKTLLELMNS